MFIHAHHVMHMHSAQHCKQWRLVNDSSHGGHPAVKTNYLSPDLALQTDLVTFVSQNFV